MVGPSAWFPAAVSSRPSSGTPMTLDTMVHRSYNPKCPIQHPLRGCAPDDKVSRSPPATSGASVTYVVSCRAPKRKTSHMREGPRRAQIVRGPQAEGRPWEQPAWTPESPECGCHLGLRHLQRQATSAGFLFYCWEPIDGRGCRGTDVREDLRSSVLGLPCTATDVSAVTSVAQSLGIAWCPRGGLAVGARIHLMIKDDLVWFCAPLESSSSRRGSSANEPGKATLEPSAADSLSEVTQSGLASRRRSAAPASAGSP